MGGTSFVTAMFTGLIEAVGEVRDARRIPAGLRLAVETGLAEELAPGDSLAINGVCLTVVDRAAASVTAEVSPETLRVTTLAQLRAGCKVNLERPLAADGRLGGHFVLGHIDGVGVIAAIERQAAFARVEFSFPDPLASYIVPKGSIAIDGISLTIAALGPDRAEVQIVPYTWEHTNLHAAHVGDAVNLECDIIGKYVVRAVGATT